MKARSVKKHVERPRADGSGSSKKREGRMQGCSISKTGECVVPTSTGIRVALHAHNTVGWKAWDGFAKRIKSVWGNGRSLFPGFAPNASQMRQRHKTSRAERNGSDQPARQREMTLERSRREGRLAEELWPRVAVPLSFILDRMDRHPRLGIGASQIFLLLSRLSFLTWI